VGHPIPFSFIDHHQQRHFCIVVVSGESACLPAKMAVSENGSAIKQEEEEKEDKKPVITNGEAAPKTTPKKTSSAAWAFNLLAK
jgi:hypothetical protein